MVSPNPYRRLTGETDSLDTVQALWSLKSLQVASTVCRLFVGTSKVSVGPQVLGPSPFPAKYDNGRGKPDGGLFAEFESAVCYVALKAYPIISPRPFGGRGVGGEGARIAAGLLN